LPRPSRRGRCVDCSQRGKGALADAGSRGSPPGGGAGPGAGASRAAARLAARCYSGRACWWAEDRFGRRYRRTGGPDAGLMSPGDGSRLYLDEDVELALARPFTAAHYDVLTARDASMLGCSDEEQLSFAVREQRALLTHNIDDFTALHERYQ